MPALSTRNSTLPALVSFTALVISMVTVPVFGLGIRPRGPSTLPSLPAARIMSGVAITASKSVQPSMIFCTMSSPPTNSAPASVASRCFSPLARTNTRTALPSPCGRTTVPRTTWSECFGSTPRLIASSTVSLNLVWCVFLISSAASASLYGRASTFLRAFSTCFPACFMPLPLRPRAPELLGFHDFQTHVASRTHHGLHRRVQICGVEIDKLDLGDFLYLLLRNFSDFIAVRLSGALDNARRPQQKNRSRRRLQNKGKRPVGVNGNQHRKNHPVRFLRRLGIELLAKIHNVQAMRTK